MKAKLVTLFIALLVASCSPRKTSWVAIGDSITYLNEHQDETGHRVTKGYLTLVSEQLTEVKYINKGYNGWTAVRIADEIESLGLEQADAYSVFLGTNDWWHGKPLGSLDDYKNKTGNETFFGAYRTIIDKLRNLNADAKIILITPMQRGDFVYIAGMTNNAYGSYRPKSGQTLEQFAKAVATIGETEKMDVVDLYHGSNITQSNLVRFKRLKDPETGTYKNFTYPEYVGIPFDPEKDEYPYPEEAIGMTYDGLHPSDEGYKVIADMLIPLLKND